MPILGSFGAGSGRGFGQRGAGKPFIEATGGTISTCGDYKIHTFTGPGTFTVTNAGNPSGSDTVDYLVVAGGGGGSYDDGGGGGAGGFRESSGCCFWLLHNISFRSLCKCFTSHSTRVIQ